MTIQAYTQSRGLHPLPLLWGWTLGFRIYCSNQRRANLGGTNCMTNLKLFNSSLIEIAILSNTSPLPQLVSQLVSAWKRSFTSVREDIGYKTAQNSQREGNFFSLGKHVLFLSEVGMVSAFMLFLYFLTSIQNPKVQWLY